MGLFLRLAVTQRERMSKTMKRKGRRRGRDMRKKHDCEIPPDLVTEILIRLPSKSLMRFKCVSKDWSSLISCRYFSHLFTVRRLQKPRLYMCLVAKDNQRVLLSSTSPDNNSFVVVDKDLSIPRMGYSANIVRGLMCFRVRKKACIYNPSTKQLLTLPAIKSDIITEQDQKKQIQYYIGHDPVSDRYKVVCTIMVSSAYLCNLKSEHWVFQLDKAGGLWKKVFPLENYHPHALGTVGRCVNGVLYYLSWIDMYNCAVFSFDTMSEELTTILVPEKVADVLPPAALMKADLIEYGGKVAIFNYTYLREVGLVDLWVLIDAGKKKWSTKSLVLQPCQRHLVQDIELMIVKGTTLDGKVILAPVEMRSRFYILCYDIQSNDLRKVEIKGVPEPWFDKECYFDLKFMDVSESLIDAAEIQNSRTNLFLVGKT